MTSVWCEYALLPGGAASGVRVDITDGRIIGVASGVEPVAGLDRRNGLTVPGAANAHSHAFHRALRHRSQAGRGTFWTWREQMYGIAAQLDPTRYHRLARATFAEMVLAGYTSVGEFHYVHRRPDGTPYAEPNEIGLALVDAAREAGIRITLLDTLYLHGGLDAHGYSAPSARQRRFVDASTASWIERVEQLRLSGHARRGAAIHSVRAVDPRAIGEVIEWATAVALPVHAHISEQPAENDQCLAVHGCTPTELFATALGPRFTAVHATHLTERDIELLGSSGSTVCLCPTTERDLGDGFGPARRLLDAGAALAIGSDSHATIDPFEEARAIELDERLDRRERGVLTTEELLATLARGHGALGWDAAGAIAVGQRADLVTLSFGTRLAGARPDALAEAVVYAASAADVTDVMVDGTDVVTAGRHRSLDVAAELDASIRATTPEANRRFRP